MTAIPPTSRWRGRVNKMLLFKGSKSEREYFVLETPERRFRLRFEGAGGEDLLTASLGQTIEVDGCADDRRGHWCLSVSTDALRRAMSTPMSASSSALSAASMPQSLERPGEKCDDIL